MNQHTHAPYHPRTPWWEWCTPCCTPRIYSALARLDDDRTPRRTECPLCSGDVTYRGGKTTKHRNDNDTCPASLLSEHAADTLMRCILGGHRPDWITQHRAPADSAPSRAALTPHLRTLAQQRTQLGITRRALAATLGCKRTASVSAWENGTQTPTIHRLIQWSQTLGLQATLTLDGHTTVLRDGTDATEQLLLQRKRLHLSQAVACAKAGFGNSTLSHWEAGTRQPHAAGYIKWADTLEATLTIEPRP